MKALVSVIIPMYNTGKYIEQCIGSILTQTHADIEILIVDDGSTDEGLEIVKRYQEKDARVSYFCQKNQGPGTARNLAIAHSEGKYLLFVDADDYLEANYIEELVKTAEENNAQLTIGGYTLVYDQNKKNRQIVPQFYERGIREEWAYRISSTCSRLYRRDFWISNNLKFSEDKKARAEDVPIVLFANVMAKRINIVKNPGYCYYQHPESAMNNKQKKVIFGFPYQAFEETYTRVKTSQPENGEAFFDFGVLKFLAQFDLVIYRQASKEEKGKFQEFICNLLKEDFSRILFHWKELRKRLDLPLTHKVAIEIFLLKYGKRMRG